MGTCRRGGHLLAENGSDRHLRLVHRAGHPAPGGRADQPRQRRVLAQQFVGRFWVGVEVEETSAARDGRCQVPEVGQRQRSPDAVLGRTERDKPHAVGEPESAPVGTVSHFLHARYGRGGEVPEEVVRRKGGLGRGGAASASGQGPGPAGPPYGAQLGWRSLRTLPAPCR